MKKKLSLLLAGLLCFGVTGCNKVPNSGFAGTYWLESHTATNVEKGFYEKIEYDVSFSEAAGDFMPVLYEMYPDYLNFYVDKDHSSYVTELYEENGLYVYHTTLKVSGKYVYGDITYDVEEDVTETISKFKGKADNFACVETKKTIKNVYPVTQHPSLDKDFVTVSAEINVAYDGKDANVSVEAKDEASKNLLATMQEPVTIKKYVTNKKAYMDNELMLLLFRNFSYDKSSSLSYTFNTIDTSTGTIKGINGSARLPRTTTESTTTQSAIRGFEEDCYIDTISDNHMKIKFNCYGVTFKTTGEYSQEFAYAYYADSIAENIGLKNDPRHYMVKCFRPAIYNIGYFVYTIKTVTHQR